MKFCPYCGASLVGGAVSFCTECGKPLPGKDRKPAAKGNARPPVRNTRVPTQISPERPASNPMDEHYDGYYDDIPPLDAGRAGERTDPELVKRIVLVILGAIGLIALSAALLMLL